MAVSVALPRPRTASARLIRAWGLVWLLDGLFATAFNCVAKGDLNVTRVWKGVASVLLGKAALGGGAGAVVVGLAMHAFVALVWSVVLLAVIEGARPVGDLMRRRRGPAVVGAVFGPFVWTVMSFVVVPAFTRRPPTVGGAWWAMWVGHAFSVGIPMAWALRPSRS